MYFTPATGIESDVYKIGNYFLFYSIKLQLILKYKVFHSRTRDQLFINPILMITVSVTTSKHEIRMFLILCCKPANK